MRFSIKGLSLLPSSFSNTPTPFLSLARVERPRVDTQTLFEDRHRTFFFLPFFDMPLEKITPLFPMVFSPVSTSFIEAPVARCPTIFKSFLRSAVLVLVIALPEVCTSV